MKNLFYIFLVLIPTYLNAQYNPIDGSILNLHTQFSSNKPPYQVITNTWTLGFTGNDDLVFRKLGTSFQPLKLTSNSVIVSNLTSNSILKSNNLITATNRIGIGTSSPQYGLHLVNRDFVISSNSGNEFKVSSDGLLIARQVDVSLDVIPDYVFDSNYNLMPLPDLSNYIKKNRHLPSIKSAQEYELIGSINIGELQLQLLEKVEELTLYTIQQQKEIEDLKQQINNLSK